MSLLQQLMNQDSKITLKMKLSRLAELRDRKRKLSEKLTAHSSDFLKSSLNELNERINNLNNLINC
jgi:hypothetical protein